MIRNKFKAIKSLRLVESSINHASLMLKKDKSVENTIKRLINSKLFYKQDFSSEHLKLSIF
jgi:hypothetical protein